MSFFRLWDAFYQVKESQRLNSLVCKWVQEMAWFCRMGQRTAIWANPFKAFWDIWPIHGIFMDLDNLWPLVVPNFYRWEWVLSGGGVASALHVFLTWHTYIYPFLTFSCFTFSPFLFSLSYWMLKSEMSQRALWDFHEYFIWHFRIIFIVVHLLHIINLICVCMIKPCILPLFYCFLLFSQKNNCCFLGTGTGCQYLCIVFSFLKIFVNEDLILVFLYIFLNINYYRAHRKLNNLFLNAAGGVLL